jgi:hypothetical protein
MIRDGWQLAYQTPVAGYPWAIPFEFPIYQTLVAFIVKLFGSSFVATGRLVSFSFLIACAWPAFQIVRRLKLPNQIAWIFCSLLWSSPLNLFYGRTFMIETAALFFSFAALPFAFDILKQSQPIKSVFFCSLYFTLAVLQKVTTGAPVIAVFLLIYTWTWLRRGGFRIPTIREVLFPMLAFLTPIIISYLWVKYSDAIKLDNVFGAELSSSKLSKWNFGSLEQKLKFSTYKEIFWDRSILLNAGGFVGFALISVSTLTSSKNLRLVIISGLALFALPIFIFTNLHIVHNYYQVGCLLFLIGSLSVAVGGWLPSISSFRPLVPVITALLISHNLYNFISGYGTVAHRTIDLTSEYHQDKALAVGESVRKYTSPNSGIIVLGNDWDSDIAFYSQRKSFTVPDSFKQYRLVLAYPSHFLGNLPLGAVVICQDDKGALRGPTIEERTKDFIANDWLIVDAKGCRLLLPKNRSNGQ